MTGRVRAGVSRAAGRLERQTTLRRHRFPRLTKFDIVNRLGAANGYSSYLELSTPTTGNKYANVDREVFDDCRRVIYRSPNEHCEFPTDVVSSALNSREGVAHVSECGERFDVVFVDPYHDRATSHIDIEQGLDVLASGGVMVVHDCLPPRRSMAGPAFEPGEWLGQTYLAFLDVVGRRDDLDYCVVNTHWGVGVVWRRAEHGPQRIESTPAAIEVQGVDYEQWRVFRKHRRQLMRVITPRQFDQVFGSVRPT